MNPEKAFVRKIHEIQHPAIFSKAISSDASYAKDVATYRQRGMLPPRYTVNTVPPATLAAFRSHGVARARLTSAADPQRVLSDSAQPSQGAQK